jgi:hypothetical protein
MKKIIFLIFYTFLFSSAQYYDNLFFVSSINAVDSLELEDYSEIEVSNQKYINNPNKIKAMLASGILPGSGQYFVNNQKTKGIIFSGIEILGWAGYMYYTNKAEKFKLDYQEYADQHWSFSNWCDHYYDYDTPDNPFRDLFSNQESGEYSAINSGHGLEFYYDGENGIRRYMKTNSSEFGEFYNQYDLDEDGNAELFVESQNLTISKTHDFYEEVVKYDQFFTGWDDQEEIERITNDWGADNATSPNKTHSKNIYNKSIDNYKIQDWFMTSIYVNHVISMIDALIVSSISSDTASLSYNYNPTIDFHQAEIIIKLN